MKTLPSSMYLRAGETIFMNHLVVYNGPITSGFAAAPPAPVGTAIITPLGGEFVGVDLSHDAPNYEVRLLSVPSAKIVPVVKKIREATNLSMFDAMQAARNATASTVMTEYGFVLAGDMTKREAAKFAYEMACAGAEVEVSSLGNVVKADVSGWKNIIRDEQIRMIRL